VGKSGWWNHLLAEPFPALLQAGLLIPVKATHPLGFSKDFSTALHKAGSKGILARHDPYGNAPQNF
jgi:hypothetical protein